MCLSLLCLVYHLWIDGSLKSDSPFFVIMTSSSPLNDKILSLVASQSVMYSLSPLNRHIAKSPFCLLLCLVRHLWTVNTPSLVISNRLCPVCHIWTDEYPISSFFVVMSSSAPLNDKASYLVIPTHHAQVIWWSLICYVNIYLWTVKIVKLFSSILISIWFESSHFSNL